jgi:hypothetical protein
MIEALIEAATSAGVTLRPRLWAEPVNGLPPELRARLRAAEAEVIRALIGDAAARTVTHPPVRTDEAGPVDRCAQCGAGRWWRASVLSGGPGVWSCAGCDPAPADVWLDACAVPGRPTHADYAAGRDPVGRSRG